MRGIRNQRGCSSLFFYASVLVSLGVSFMPDVSMTPASSLVLHLSTWLLEIGGLFHPSKVFLVMAVRLPLHQLACLGWCSLIPLAGLLLVDWSSPVRRLASDSGEIGDCLGLSMKKTVCFKRATDGLQT
ncbi:hypothetical protein GQ55_9G203700 [Panicum hallii var. hallii]|uniref:Uncharacterized protein n=1 Tax=Panicum hallii var. hallii TaxID=1504633 RepID=A0A2T7C5A5_9POAL|nr:hypothetical protein GQ55_9G203700 [Panicum hallii var. hallii]